MLYSTGSSRVIRFVSSLSSSLTRVYMVEDLPLPVGPTIRMTPLVSEVSRSSFRFSDSGMPIAFRSSMAAWPPRIRITAFSPCIVGSVESRISTVSPFSFTEALPSCGILLSTVSIRPMILMREMTESRSSFGIVRTLCSLPSILMRMTIS